MCIDFIVHISFTPAFRLHWGTPITVHSSFSTTFTFTYMLCFHRDSSFSPTLSVTSGCQCPTPFISVTSAYQRSYPCHVLWFHSAQLIFIYLCVYLGTTFTLHSLCFTCTIHDIRLPVTSSDHNCDIRLSVAGSVRIYILLPVTVSVHNRDIRQPVDGPVHIRNIRLLMPGSGHNSDIRLPVAGPVHIRDIRL